MNFDISKSPQNRVSLFNLIILFCYSDQWNTFVGDNHVLIIAISNLWRMDEYMTSSSGAAFNFALWSNAPMLLSTETENPKQLPK